MARARSDAADFGVGSSGRDESKIAEKPEVDEA